MYVIVCEKVKWIRQFYINLSPNDSVPVDVLLYYFLRYQVMDGNDISAQTGQNVKSRWQVENLGVIYASHLTFEPHITNITKNAENMPDCDTETVMHVFITFFWIEYCTALLSDLLMKKEKDLVQLQLLQNSAAHVLTIG